MADCGCHREDGYPLTGHWVMCPMHEAAPELLEALRFMVQIANSPEEDDLAAWPEVMSRAEAAIAKALGQEATFAP